jgi:hypothetical protein
MRDRFEPVGEVGVRGPVAPLADGRRCPLEHVEVLGRLGQRRHALDAARPGADEGHDLVREAGEGLTRTAARVAVVPSCGVERASGELLHARDDGQLHQVEDPDGQDVPTAAHIVSPVGPDPPPGGVLVPFGAGHPGVEQGVSHQVVPAGDGLEVATDLLAEGVALGGDVVELLEHREVDGRLDIAHHARVAVPVPGASDTSGLVDDADPLHAGLAELGTGEDPGDPPAHDDHIDVVGHGLALDDRRERVVAVAGEVLVGAQVTDGGASGHQSLVALGQVPGADGLRVVIRVRRIGFSHVGILGQGSFSAWEKVISGAVPQPDDHAPAPAVDR